MNNFDVHITANKPLLKFNLRLVWKYRDLIKMFVYRDFVTNYKQTILGPLWFLIQPCMYALMNLFIFGSLAKIGPEGIPGFLFYLSGPIFWQYFQDGFLKISGVFVDNQHIFGKVYFPRLVMPLTIIISGLLKLSVQLVLLIGFMIFYYYDSGYKGFNPSVFFVGPLILLNLIIVTLGLGLIVSSLTAKYRDLKFFFDFFIPILKFITPGIATTYLIYLQDLPTALVPFAKYNPLGVIIDSFNYFFVGAGQFEWVSYFITLAFGTIVLFLGMILFNQTEKKFMDTV